MYSHPNNYLSESYEVFDEISTQVLSDCWLTNDLSFQYSEHEPNEIENI